MNNQFSDFLNSKIKDLKETGLYKSERVIATPQGAFVRVGNGAPLLNLCSNNYLGMAQFPEILKAAHEGLDAWGYGMSSVRFICGTQKIHKDLETRLSAFLGTDDTILYSSCFDANGGLFETLLDEKDAIVSDELNHASIIDGIRLCKAMRFRYQNNDMASLEDRLQQAQAAKARFILIATDGVFSMDGTIANLPDICTLADKYQAMVMVDDSHAVGFMGKTGRGTHEFHNVVSRIDVLTGTLGKALGGASGGYTSGRSEIIEILRQRSRPYLFSNTLAPVIVSVSLKVLDILESSTQLRDQLETNTRYFRSEMDSAGWEVIPGIHPITPVMVRDALVAGKVANAMLEKRVYVVGFSFPVVPKGKARIRTQVSAAHSRSDLDFAVTAFKEVRKTLG